MRGTRARSRPGELSQHDLAEVAKLLAVVATHLSLVDEARRQLIPMGIPIRRGRLNLGRPRSCLPASGPIAVAVGVASDAWLGPLTAASPSLGRLGYRSVSRIDERGRVVFDRRVPGWLGVADAAAFEVVAVRADPVGVLVVPVEDFDRRWQELSP